MYNHPFIDWADPLILWSLENPCYSHSNQMYSVVGGTQYGLMTIAVNVRLWNMWYVLAVVVKGHASNSLVN